MREMKIVVCRMMPALLLLPALIACHTPAMVTPASVPTLILPTATIAPLTLSIPTPVGTAPASGRPPYHLIATPTDGIAPLSVTFQIAITAIADLRCATQRLDFGDGTTEYLIGVSCSPYPGGKIGATPTPQPMSRVVTHVYARVGTYVAMICMERPCEASGQVTITVH